MATRFSGVTNKNNMLYSAGLVLPLGPGPSALCPIKECLASLCNRGIIRMALPTVRLTQPSISPGFAAQNYLPRTECQAENHHRDFGKHI
jgi:hypothetical protein